MSHNVLFMRLNDIFLAKTFKIISIPNKPTKSWTNFEKKEKQCSNRGKQ